MKKPTIKVRPYNDKNRSKYKFVIDLRAWGQGRLFFETKSQATEVAILQKRLLERHSQSVVGMSQRDMMEINHARETLAKYGETLSDALAFRVDYLERVRRSGVTVATLADEVLEAKRKDGLSEKYLGMLRLYFKRFSQDF